VNDNTGIKYLALLFEKNKGNKEYSHIKWDTPGYVTCNGDEPTSS